MAYRPINIDNSLKYDFIDICVSETIIFAQIISLTDAFFLRAIIPGISCSAISISRLPYDA